MVVPAKYRGFRVTRGDPTGEQLAILVPTDYRVLHIASAAYEETDWNVANPTHPTAYIHSETTPATDYLSLSHDATTGIINSYGGTIALGVSGTAVLTSTASVMTLGAVDLVLASGQGLISGSATQVTISDGDGATNLIPEVQALGVGTAFAGGSVLAATFNTTNTRAVSPKIALVKGGAATQVATTVLADNEVAGSIIAYGSDGADFESPVAAIEFVVDQGTVSAGVMGGSLEFYTTALGGETLTLRGTISSLGLLTLAAGTTPASVGTTPGTAHPGSMTVTGGLGGNTSIGTTGVGGIGAGFSFTSGAGGTANSATTSATGGAGGAWVTTTGAGGAAAVAGVTGIGGAGGALTLTTGAGGAVSLAVSGTATGGAAGLLTIQGGVGGAVTATTGTNVGGAGGDVSIIAGAGGAASGATDTGGRGGDITITPGAGGTGDANAAGRPGYVNISTGITRRSVQTIDMADAAVVLTLVPGTPVGTLMTSDVLYVDANSSTNENLDLPPEANLTGVILVIVNTGGETINIRDDAGGAVLTLETGNTAVITCDGTTLRGVVGVP